MAQQMRRGVGGRRPLARAVAACCAATALGCLMWSVAYLLRNAVQLGSASSAGFFAGFRSGGSHIMQTRCPSHHAATYRRHGDSSPTLAGETIVLLMQRCWPSVGQSSAVADVVQNSMPRTVLTDAHKRAQCRPDTVALLSLRLHC